MFSSSFYLMSCFNIQNRIVVDVLLFKLSFIWNFHNTWQNIFLEWKYKGNIIYFSNIRVFFLSVTIDWKFV